MEEKQTIKEHDKSTTINSQTFQTLPRHRSSAGPTSADGQFPFALLSLGLNFRRFFSDDSSTDGARMQDGHRPLQLSTFERSRTNHPKRFDRIVGLGPVRRFANSHSKLKRNIGKTFH